VGEARRLVSPLVEAGPSWVVIYGLGLGYHVEALREELPGVEILIYEPYEEVFRAAFLHPYGTWQADPRIQVVQRIEDLEDELIQRCIYGDPVPLPALWMHPVYRRLAPEEAARLEKIFLDLKVRQTVNAQTIQGKKGLWLKNIIANWPRILVLPWITHLAHFFRNVPCIIVGAGPSLQKNFHLLEPLGQKSLIFAAGSVYGWLRERGISSHLVGISEGHDVRPLMDLKAHGEEDGEWLVLSSSAHPQHFNEWLGRQCTFHAEKWVSRVLAQEPFIPHGGHICSAAFTIGLVLGCNPLILVGQDLSYGEEDLHVPGIIKIPEEEILKTQRFPMAGREGAVYGHGAMVSYLSWYEESARYLAGKRPELKLINATQGGARIRGFHELSLAEAGDRFCTTSWPIPSMLETHLVSPPPDRAGVKMRLEQILQDLCGFQGSPPYFPAGSLAGELCQWLKTGSDIPWPEILHQSEEVVQSLMEKTSSIATETTENTESLKL
jgi:hypothetical protein